MIWRLLADAVALIHLGFVVFVVIGGFLAWRWRVVLYAHLPALAWALWIELTSGICPLTPLENRLRIAAGEEGYSGGFIEHYILPLLYPVGLTPQTQWVLAALLAVINVAVYVGLVRRMRASR